MSCVRFSVAKQNKPRLETRARSHAAADSTGPPAHGRGVEKGAPGPSASPGRAEHDRTRLQPHEALPQAATRHDRLDETSLANLRLILIAIHLKVFITFLTPEIYSTMSEEEQNLLKRDIASFLRQMHGLDYTDISECTIDNKQNVLEEYILLRETIYNDLTDIEKDYIESFMERLNATTVFEGKKCLCHNDFSCNHLLLDGNNRLTGIIDFGDSGIIDEYCDFIYLLEDSEEEIGTNFGEDILRMYGNIDIEKAKEYQDIVEEYYPIETIVYGIKNIKQEFIENGRKEIYKRTYKD